MPGSSEALIGSPGYLVGMSHSATPTTSEPRPKTAEAATPVGIQQRLDNIEKEAAEGAEYAKETHNQVLRWLTKLSVQERVLLSVESKVETLQSTGKAMQADVAEMKADIRGLKETVGELAEGIGSLLRAQAANDQTDATQTKEIQAVKQKLTAAQVLKWGAGGGVFLGVSHVVDLLIRWILKVAGVGLRYGPT